MKYIKTYEYYGELGTEDEFLKNPIKIGDYVIVDPSEFSNSKLREQLENVVGEVVNIEKLASFPVEVKYSQYVRLNGQDKNIIPVTYNEVIYWSEDKDELEVLIQAKKYNL